MTKVYPGGHIASLQRTTTTTTLDLENAPLPIIIPNNKNQSSILTVWKKSLLFNSDGFTVFDAQGNLLYRVDNYGSSSDVAILMDAAGNSLLTIRRKKRRFGSDSTWLVYKGDSSENPIFSVRKNANILSHNKCVAQVREGAGNNKFTRHDDDEAQRPVYEIEGSFSRRCCGVYDDTGRKVAEIKQKEAPAKGVALGMDIFNLVVQPGLIDPAFAMAIVILLDQMFGSSSSFQLRRIASFKS